LKVYLSDSAIRFPHGFNSATKTHHDLVNDVLYFNPRFGRAKEWLKLQRHALHCNMKSEMTNDIGFVTLTMISQHTR